MYFIDDYTNALVLEYSSNSTSSDRYVNHTTGASTSYSNDFYANRNIVVLYYANDGSLIKDVVINKAQTTKNDGGLCNSYISVLKGRD